MEEVATSSNKSFPRKLRIRKSEEFTKLFRNSRRIQTRNFILYIKNNNLGFPRLGISISRKVASRSVERNRIKRLVRESFRSNKTEFNANDIIVVVKNNIPGSKMSVVFTEIKNGLKRLN